MKGSVCTALRRRQVEDNGNVNEDSAAMWLAYTIASSRQPEDGANVFGAAVARWVDCTLG